MPFLWSLLCALCALAAVASPAAAVGPQASPAASTAVPQDGAPPVIPPTESPSGSSAPASAPGPVLLEVVADVRPVTRFLTDPETLLPRKDSFDLVYLAAYFSEPIYARAVDGSRYAVRDLWHRPEAAQLAQAFELRCPRDGVEAAAEAAARARADGRDGVATLRGSFAGGAAADAEAGEDVFVFSPSHSPYPTHCLANTPAPPSPAARPSQSPAAAAGVLTALSPPFRWSEQAFGGAPPGSMRSRLPLPPAPAAAATAAGAGADAAEEALLRALWGADADMLDEPEPAHGAEAEAEASVEDEEEDEEGGHGLGLPSNALPLVFVARHTLPSGTTAATAAAPVSDVATLGVGAMSPEARTRDLSQCSARHMGHVPASPSSAGALTRPLTAERLSRCRLVLPAPLPRSPTAAGAPAGTRTGAAGSGVALVGSRGAPVHPSTSEDAAVSAPVRARVGAPVRLFSVAGAPLDTPAAPALAATAAAAETADSNATDAEAAAAAAAAARLSRVHALASARRATCASTVAQERAAFIESSVATVTGLVQPVLNTMMGDSVTQTNDLVLGGVSNQFSQDVTHAMTGPMPSIVVTAVTMAVPRNLTHLITDAVAGALVNLLAASVPNRIAGPIAQSVYERTHGIITERLARIATQVLVRGIHDQLGPVIARELTLALTSKLTRSVTHALVPTVARALGVTYHFSYLCHLCTHHGAHCGDCAGLQVGQYHIQHYSLQFSEYYSGYYGDYYRDALYMLDQVQFSNPDYTYQRPFATPPNVTPLQEPPTPDKVADPATQYSDLLAKAARVAGDAAAGTNPEPAPSDAIMLDPMRGLGGRGAAGYGGGTDTPGLRPIAVEGIDNDAPRGDLEQLAIEGYLVYRDPPQGAVVEGGGGPVEGEKPQISRGMTPIDVAIDPMIATPQDGTLRLNRWRLPHERDQGSQGQKVVADAAAS